MNLKARLATTIVWVITTLVLLTLGAYIEIDVVEFVENFRDNGAFVPMALFFATVNLNVLLLFVLVFLVFRNGVKLVVDRRRHVLGSSLRTKLVTSFLFFSLLPTVILLYISTKFVNANFERWLPQDLVHTTQQSLATEKLYRAKLLELLANVDSHGTGDLAGADFRYDPSKGDKGVFLARDASVQALKPAITRAVKDNAGRISATPKWIMTDDEHLIGLVRGAGGHLAGVVAPRSAHPQWQALSAEFSQAQPGVELVRMSYYVMLGVLTLLVVFSATWLGFTIAREMTVPIQVLAAATEAVAQGDYNVRIDDIVSDDELGSLARSFRSMVADLNSARESASRATTELKAKADELFEKSEYNAILLRDINAAVITTTQHKRVASWNQEAALLFGVPEVRAIGARLDEVIEPAFFHSALSPLLAEVETAIDHYASGEFSGRLKGEDVQLQLTVSVVNSPKGEADTVVFINDITELARAQRIAAWRDVARRIAHEIKNPLTPIKLGAQRLQRRFEERFPEPQDAEVFRECVKVILHSTESIKRLVDEFIRFARMPQPNLREGDLREPVRMAVAGFEGNPEHVTVALTVMGQQPLRARFDHDQIVRLCSNLVANAIAASAQGEAKEVRVEVGPSESAPRSMRITVADTGAGIPDSLKSKIFEPYFSTKRTGMGLGLVIVQQIVSDHGGRMAIENNTPSGTLFLVEIPVGT